MTVNFKESLKSFIFHLNHFCEFLHDEKVLNSGQDCGVSFWARCNDIWLDADKESSWWVWSSARLNLKDICLWAIWATSFSSSFLLVILIKLDADNPNQGDDYNFVQNDRCDDHDWFYVPHEEHHNGDVIEKGQEVIEEWIVEEGSLALERIWGKLVWTILMHLKLTIKTPAMIRQSATMNPA